MAYVEFHLAAGSAKAPRQSEQFFYWACKEVDGTPTEGTTLATAQGTEDVWGLPERDMEV